MRMLGVLTGLLMFAGFTGAGETPTTAPAAKTYTLGNDNKANIAKNPTRDQIKAAIGSLDGEKVMAVYVSADEKHSIQANWEAANKISFQHVDGGDDHMYVTKTKTYSPDTAVKLFMSYMSGKDEWLKMVDWEPQK